jgi:hypothetical protein
LEDLFHAKARRLLRGQYHNLHLICALALVTFYGCAALLKIFAPLREKSRNEEPELDARH